MKSNTEKRVNLAQKPYIYVTNLTAKTEFYMTAITSFIDSRQ